MAHDYTKLAEWLAMAEAIEDANVVLRTDEDGVLLKNSDGVLITKCAVCPYCKDGTRPDTITAVISDVVPNSGCTGGIRYGSANDYRWFKWLESPAPTTQTIVLSRGTSARASCAYTNGGCNYYGSVAATAGSIAVYDSEADCGSDTDRIATVGLDSFSMCFEFFPHYSGPIRGVLQALLNFDATILHWYATNERLNWFFSLFEATLDLGEDYPAQWECSTVLNESNDNTADNATGFPGYNGSIVFTPSTE